MTGKPFVPGSEEQVQNYIDSVNRKELPDWIAAHLQRYAEDPVAAHDWDATFAGGKPRTPTLLLTTTGRKSGKPFTLPLLYGRDGDRFVLVGSKGGAPEHPAWYRNLQANPRATIQVADKRYDVIARTVEGAERQRLWDMMCEVYPPFPGYQQRTERLIPVIVLETTTG